MSEITKAIAARQTQIAQLESDIETLQRAASVLGGETTAKATPARQPTTSPQRKAKRMRKPWSAAAKRAMSKRIKASWAKRKRASVVSNK